MLNTRLGQDQGDWRGGCGVMYRSAVATAAAVEYTDPRSHSMWARLTIPGVREPLLVGAMYIQPVSGHNVCRAHRNALGGSCVDEQCAKVHEDDAIDTMLHSRQHSVDGATVIWGGDWNGDVTTRLGGGGDGRPGKGSGVEWGEVTLAGVETG